MDTSRYDEKIADLENQKDSTLKEMAEIYDKFIEATINFTRIWSKKQVEKYIASKHKLTLSKNELELQKMKIECADLIKKIPSIIDKNLNTDKYWVHMHLSLTEFYSSNKNYSTNLKNMIKIPLSIIMGFAGKILIQGDYIDPYDQRCDWSINNNRTVRYNDRKFEINEEMTIYIDKYSEKSNELKEIVDKIKITEDDKEKFKAINRWKQIKTD